MADGCSVGGVVAPAVMCARVLVFYAGEHDDDDDVYNNRL